MLHHPISRAILLFLAFIAGGLVLFLFDAYEVGSPPLIAGLLVGMTLVKLRYFVGSVLGWVRRAGQEDAYRRPLLLFLLVSVLLMISSYAIDYYCLARIYPDAFHLPLGHQNVPRQLLTFLYYSAGRFTTASGGEVYPTASLAQVYVMSEVLLAYFTTVLIIANLGLLQAIMAGVARPGRDEARPLPNGPAPQGKADSP